MVEEHRLDELSLGSRRRYLQQGLARKHGGALRHGPDITSEPQSPEGRDVMGGEAMFFGEPGQVGVGEREGFQERQAVLQAGRYQEAPVRRQAAREQAEGCWAGHAPAQVARRHVQLVQVGEQATRHKHYLPRPQPPAVKRDLTTPRHKDDRRLTAGRRRLP